jgi:hypothetical protein
MPAVAPVERLELFGFIDEGASLFPVVDEVAAEDEGELDAGITVPPVWLASARRGADGGMNLSRSEACHATLIGLAKATVTDASPGS